MSGIVTKETPWTFAETMSRLLAAVAERRMKLFAVIDHSGEAAAAGLELRDTKVVIFGSPRGGTPVMIAAPLAALDLPLKVLVWQDGNRTKLSYLAPEAFAKRYGVNDELTAPLAGIEGIIDAVIKGQTAPPTAGEAAAGDH